MYEGLNEKQNQNHAISTSKNELFFVIVPKIVKSKKNAIFPIFQGIFPEKFPRLRTLVTRVMTPASLYVLWKQGS